MTKAGLNQKRIAAEHGIAADTVGALVNATRNVGLMTFEDLCNIVGVKPEEVAGFEPRKGTSSPDATPALNLSEQLGRLGGEFVITKDNKGSVLRFLGVLEDIPKEDYALFAERVAALATEWSKRRRQPPRRRELP